MATAGIINCSSYGLECTGCNELLIAPNRSEYVSKYNVRHFWSCETCGHTMDVHIRLARGSFKPRSSNARPVSLVA